MGTVTKRFDVCAPRKYEVRGEEKTHWINCGEAAQWDDGGISLRIHAMPSGNWFDGQLKLFERKPKEQQAPRQSQSSGSFDESEDVPF